MAAPRQLVSVERLGKGFGAGPVLSDVSLGIAGGDRIGIVGANGAGKTTLLSLVARLDEPDTGNVTWTTDLRVGLLGQLDTLDPAKTIRDEVIGGLADHEWAGDRRMREVLEGTLGGVAISRFPDGLDTVIGPLSGGERRRIALAKLLLEGPELLLLDEPTNHLDLEAVGWLAGHLVARRGALVVVTHDRWFLDTVCSRTWEIDRGGVLEHDGGYAAWVLARAERERVAAVTEGRRQNLLRKELAWLRRGPPARTTKPKFRIDAANAMIANEPVARDRAELMRFATARLGRSVLDVEGASVTLGDRAILKRVTWRLGPGDRMGLVGVNGSGKTTLLRLLSGELEPSEGVVKRGSTVQLGTLSQDLEELAGDQRVLESLESVRQRIALGDGRELTASQLCERFGFVGNRQWAFVSDLSGGERRRLQLMRLMMREPNVLLLDEPTNDLDIDTLTALEDLLDGWPGTLVVVSHDRYFVERVCDDVYAITDGGGIAHMPGGIEQYLELRRQELEQAVAPAPVKAAPAAKGGGARRDAQKEAVRLERELTRLEARQAVLHGQLAEHATSYERVAALDAELRDLLAERARVEDAWLATSELLD
ncbi:MAG TPA: ABC-F family ATP-binding cassette domain-containing protein [Gaiellales bacterium]